MGRLVRRVGLVLVVVGVALSGSRVAGAVVGGLASITPGELREWLTYIASDDLQGRAVFGTGIGLAASYIEDHLRAWHVKPGGDHGSYLQTVKIVGVRTTSHSSITVTVGGESKTFEDGHGITLPKNMGGPQRFTVDRVEFAGYGLDAPRVGHVDFPGEKARAAKGAVVVWLGAAGPRDLDASYRRALAGRSRYMTEQLGAAASIGVVVPNGRGGAPPAAAPAPAGRAATIPAADFTTVQRLDTPIPPNVTADDTFYEFLFKNAPEKYAALKQKADAQDALPSFHLDGVSIAFDIAPTYEVVRTQLAHNIVAVVEGIDPTLKSTYVAFGAHYDHVGYAEGETVTTDGQMRRVQPPGVVTKGAEADRIWNGADDDGSGTVALMALAHAFAQGSRPKRSLLFVWHVGEERGLWGSRYFADYPTVPMASIVSQLNIDMIGRNRDNKASESNTVYLVGSDRISSELHALNETANRSLAKPLTLDYEMNDPADLEQVYYRSDHYSYAAKGVPIIFFTTGLHPDYHANTDEVSKIEFGKLSRIVQLVYATGQRVANLDHAPVRDNLGPRAGRTTTH